MGRFPGGLPVISFTRLLALIRKEARHIYRDPQVLFMAIIGPAFILFLLAYVFSFDSSEIRFGVMDLDHSAASRQIIADLTATDELILVRECVSYAEIERLLQRGDAGVVVVIPSNFGATVAAGRPASLQAILDASDYNESSLAYADLAARVQQIGLALRAESSAAVASTSLSVQTRILYNPTGKSVYAMVPGLMAAAFCFPAIAAALACTRETERGSYESLLSTPMGKAEYLLGKLLPYVGAGLLSALLTLALACFWFHVPLRGSVGAYLGLTLTFLLALMGVSITVGVAATSQRHTIIIIILMFFIPTFFMSGLLVPLDAGRPMAAIIKLVLPAANYVAANRAVFLKGVGLADLWVEIANMLRIFCLSLIASYLLARRKVA
jgi:ABC-2 type transport system permease protein